MPIIKLAAWLDSLQTRSDEPDEVRDGVSLPN
jgi:hypothetical protein